MSNNDNKAFNKYVPSFTYSMSGNTITVMVKPVPGANNYKIYRSKTIRGKKEYVKADSSPIIHFNVDDGKSYYYRVQAGKGGYYDNVLKMQHFQEDTAYSEPQYIDILAASKDRSEKMDKFFEAVKQARDVLGYEDLDIAIESLKLAGIEIKEREERRKLEAEAEQKKKEIEAQNKRRQAAAKRAEARREKKRLEHIEEVTRMELPMDFVNVFDADARASEHCGSMAEALMSSLDNLGMVDIEFMASVTGEDMKTVISSLKGTIYQNPLHWDEVFYKGWETVDEYLSGNLMHKLKLAKEANEKYNGYFQSNVDAIEAVIDGDIKAEDIYITLGSPWVPTDIIDDFIAYMAFGGNLASNEAKEYYELCSEADYAVRHDEYSGLWEIPHKTRFRTSKFHGMFEEVNYKTYGTNRMDMLYVLENTLNMKTLSVTDLKDPFDPECKTRVLNQDETVKLLEKQRYMIETFRKWVWDDEARKTRLQSAYSRKYGYIRKRIFDGSFLEFSGMSDEVSLYDYQKNAVARILFSPNTLLAHDVGAGKTYTMIAAGMELRRLGKSKKNLYVVPNNIIGQWESIFHKMYPDANVFTVTSKNFNPKKRSETLNTIKDEDFDAIIMAYSCFDMLSLSEKYYINLYQERLAMLEKARKVFYSQAKIDKKRKRIQETLEKLQKSYKKNPKIIPFDELGINTLFVDEAHNYKNIDIDSRISGVRGSGSGGSGKGNGMLDKVHCIQRENNGGRVVFATGTPVTNSLADIYVMQKYLQEGELEYQGILTFDAWAGMFAEKVTDYEIDVDTNSYHLITRFARFCNIPELTATLSSIADFHKVDRSNGLPEFEGYDDSLLEGSEDFKNYLKDISNRADDIRHKRVNRTEDNMLKVTSDGRKAALDMRLIDTVFGLDPYSKVMKCAENIAEVYENSRDTLDTQLVFCDSSTPKAGFNLYDELKRLLVAMGVPDKEVAFVHDADGDAKRKELFAKMNKGEIAVLVGSTAKLGHGVNVQKRLAAIHHLDVPWRPSDMVQREGRILRQGNEKESVKIFRYVTRASFDAYSWQLLETKQRFIGQIMSGEVTVREGGDVEDTVLNYAEVKALAIGNPKIKKRVEVCNELEKYQILQRDYVEERQKKQQVVLALPEKIEAQKKKIADCIEDIKAYEAEKIDYNAIPYTEQKAMREKIFHAAWDNQNSNKEFEVMTYQGFKIVIPAYMVPRMSTRKATAISQGESEDTTTSRTPIPYIHIVKNGTYYLEIESESGISKRINNFLENLEVQKEKYEDVLLSLETKLKITEEELSKEGAGYVKEIESLSAELQILNEELGVA